MSILNFMPGILLGSLALLAPLHAQAPQPGRAVMVKPAAQAPAQGEKRVALVIGNGAYADAPLKNPVSDARSMAKALRNCGFQVIALENASLQSMREGLRDFGGRISQGGVGLFYFAGHGMQVKGRNYLMPVGADIRAEDEIAGAALDVDSVLAKLETARNRLNILILDACRNDPFARSFRSANQGLAPLDAPMGTFIAFATAPGRTAADGGSHGLYTEQLLKAIQEPGLKLEETFKRVLSEVRQVSNGQQIPWTASSVEGDFYFQAGPKAAEEAAAAPAPLPAPTPPARAAAPPAGWKTYLYPAYGFRADFPAEPTLGKIRSKTDIGPVDTCNYIASFMSKAYMVSTTDYGNRLAKADPKVVINGAMNGSVANSHATITSQEDITLEGHPGVAYEAESDSLHFSSRIIFSGSTLYLVMVISPNVSKATDAGLLFDSFGLIPKAP